MITEFTGLPGSGKTTLISEIKQLAQQQDKSILFAKDEILKGARVGFFKHNQLFAGIALDTILLFVFVANYTRYKHIFRLARRYVNTSGQALFCRLNLIRNIIKKLSIYHYCQHRFCDQNLLIDEGLYHMAFNIFVDSSARVVPDREIEHFLELIPWPNVLIIVEAPEDIIMKRLRQRGHRRIDFEDQHKYENFANDCRRVFRLIKRHSKHHTIAIEVSNEEWRPIKNVAQDVMMYLRRTSVAQSIQS